ncbi:unnamed protein product [Cunninghamella blakesleeana]
MWASTEFFLNELESIWLQHENTGVRIYAYKCIGQLLLITSKKERTNKNYDEEDKYTDVFSLNMLRPGHRLLNQAMFEKKNQQWLDLLLDRLTDQNETMVSVITAIINCLPSLVKLRPQFTRIIIGTLVSWCKKKPTYLKEHELRHIEKSIKLAFIAMVRNERLSAYRSELIGAFGNIGGNIAIFQNRRDDPSRRKRGHHHQDASSSSSNAERSEKRIRTEKPLSSTSTPLQPPSNVPNIDVTLLPLNIVVDLCVAILQNVTNETIEQRISMVPLSMLKEEPERSTTPPLPPPESLPLATSTTEEIEIKKEGIVLENEKDKMDVDDTTAAETKTEKIEKIIDTHTPLASIEERASQSLRIQPYNLADPLPLSNDERTELVKMSIQRLLDMNEPAQIAHSSMRSDQQQSLSHYPFHTSSSITMKHFWIGLLSKLMTRGLSIGIMKRLFLPSSLSPSPPLSSSIENNNNENENEETEIIKEEVKKEDINDIKMDIEEISKLDETKEDKSTVLDNITMYDENKENIIDSKVADSMATIDQQISDQWKNVLLDFITRDFPNRYELAIAWLHEERYYDMRYSKSTFPNNNEKRQHTYFDWLYKLMDRSITELDPKDKTLNKLLLALPTLNKTIITKLNDVMNNQPHRFVMCVATFRDLTMQRPTVRRQCLDILLELCIHDDIKRRSTAIAAVKRWVPTHPTLSEKVESYGIEMLHMVLIPSTVTKRSKKITTNDNDQQLQQDKELISMEKEDKEKNEEQQDQGTPKEEEGKNDNTEEKEEVLNQENNKVEEEMKEENNNTNNENTEVEDEDDEIVEWNEKDVIRYMDLFLALCTKKYELLEQLFPVYMQAEKQVQGWIRTHIYKTVSTMNSDSGVLLHLIKDYPKGCETLILRILNILCSNPAISAELRSTVRYIYFDKGLRAKFLLPIINNK